MIRYGDYKSMEMPMMPFDMPRDIKMMELAKAYVVEQPYTALYPLEEGFKKGTIFPDLYRPYKSYKECD